MDHAFVDATAPMQPTPVPRRARQRAPSMPTPEADASVGAFE
jgi:hypothetical protein